MGESRRTFISCPATPLRGVLDEDGTPCSSDYGLRLTGDGGRMRKGQIGLTPTRPTQQTVQA